ncbi:MAG: phosphate signaling complex protein PhoU [Leptolyngbyaceae bacterium]|nr:phosphate signaling complex protein PhoU [Leptolyngbyaceae bacterium]
MNDIPPASKDAPLIRPYFERQLREMQRDVLRMGALVELSCWLACRSLFERDLAAAQQIRSNEKQIDIFYRQIEVDCINLIGLHAPVAQDLRFLSALMQLIRDLERIGDYAEDLGEIAIKLFPYRDHECLPQVQIMADRCRAMLAMSLAALSNLDSHSGLDLKKQDDLVDDDYDRIYHILVHQKSTEIEIETVILLVLSIRCLERMADHATNIGRRVAYVVTGRR